jgi:hypothetical protein
VVFEHVDETCGVTTTREFVEQLSYYQILNKVFASWSSSEIRRCRF